MSNSTPVFKSTANNATLATLPIGQGDRLLEVVGDPNNIAYEWVISRNGVVQQQSDNGYPNVELAMRDGLIAALGLGDPAEKPRPDEVLIAIGRPEGYEDVHPQLVAEDAMKAARGWEYRVIYTTGKRPDQGGTK